MVPIDLYTSPSTMIITTHFTSSVQYYNLFILQMLPHLFSSTFLFEDSQISMTLKWYPRLILKCVFICVLVITGVQIPNNSETNVERPPPAVQRKAGLQEWCRYLAPLSEITGWFWVSLLQIRSSIWHWRMSRKSGSQTVSLEMRRSEGSMIFSLQTCMWGFTLMAMCCIVLGEMWWEWSDVMIHQHVQGLTHSLLLDAPQVVPIRPADLSSLPRQL